MQMTSAPPAPNPGKVHNKAAPCCKGTVATDPGVAEATDLLRMQTCMTVAKALQQNMLPLVAPHIAGLDINARCLYSGQLGGDYFDYMDFAEVCCGSPEHIAIAIGDVSGHGVAAALLMATIRAYIRSRVTQPGKLGKVISDVNRLVARDTEHSGHFMTLFFLDINRQRRELSWIRAGHDAALYFNALSGGFEFLSGDGVALGVDPDYHFVLQRRSGLNEGDIILLGTDGIWETRSPNGEHFGKERLKPLIERNARASSAEMVDRIINAIADFRQGQPQEDDLSLVVVKIAASH